MGVEVSNWLRVQHADPKAGTEKACHTLPHVCCGFEARLVCGLSRFPHALEEIGGYHRPEDDYHVVGAR